MQIVALASGNPVVGALSMFLFSLGTVPLMLGLGSAVSALGKRFASAVMNVGAVLVVVLGLAMLSQGGSLSGLLPPEILLPFIVALCVVGIISLLPIRKPLYKILLGVAVLGAAVLFVNLDSLSGPDLNAGRKTGAAYADAGGIQIVDGKQLVNSTLASGRYPDISVQAGTPVRWVIDAPSGSINGCNNRMLIQEYGVEHSFTTGENVIEFTPTRTGNVRYSCWMGMIRGNITVIGEGDTAPGNNSVAASGDSP
jgi:hypothetical protein